MKSRTFLRQNDLLAQPLLKDSIPSHYLNSCPIDQLTFILIQLHNHHLTSIMIAARASRRVATRNVRAVRVNAPRARFQSTTQRVADKATPDSPAGQGFSAGLAGGLTGGAIVFLVRTLVALHQT